MHLLAEVGGRVAPGRDVIDEAAVPDDQVTLCPTSRPWGAPAPSKPGAYGTTFHRPWLPPPSEAPKYRAPPMTAR